MWNKLNMLYHRATDLDTKLEIKELMENLDSREGKKEARAYIRKHSKGTWFSWKG